MFDEKRQTGRTTRMLEEAIRLAREGNSVLVIAATARHARELSARLAESGQYARRFVTVQTCGEVGNFNWEAISVPWGHGSHEILVDHFAIESRFAKMLEELTRYDEPKKPGLRRCEVCNGPGPTLHADSGANCGRYACKGCHPEPSRAAEGFWERKP